MSALRTQIANLFNIQHVCTCTLIYTHICICIYICMCVYMYVFIYLYVCLCVCLLVLTLKGVIWGVQGENFIKIPAQYLAHHPQHQCLLSSYPNFWSLAGMLFLNLDSITIFEWAFGDISTGREHTLYYIEISAVSVICSVMELTWEKNLHPFQWIIVLFPSSIVALCAHIRHAHDQGSGTYWKF